LEWVEEMLESAIHTIEEIARDTEHLDFFSVDSLHDPADEARSQDMSDMDVGYVGNLFAIP
jgi:hypothetical protein